LDVYKIFYIKKRRCVSVCIPADIGGNKIEILPARVTITGVRNVSFYFPIRQANPHANLGVRRIFTLEWELLLHTVEEAAAEGKCMCGRDWK
jgi:hypothetical protein